MNNLIIRKKCHQCDMYEHQPGEEAGICFRNPPTPQIMMMPVSRPNILSAQQESQMQPVPVSIDTIVPKNRRACGEFKGNLS